MSGAIKHKFEEVVANEMIDKLCHARRYFKAVFVYSLQNISQRRVKLQM